MEALSSVATGRAAEKILDNLSVAQSSDILFKQKPIANLQEIDKRRIPEDRLKDVVEQANALSVMFDRSLKFEYRREADIYQVSVIDTSKDEVVRKIPPDEVVRFIESIKDMFGALLDVQA